MLKTSSVVSSPNRQKSRNDQGAHAPWFGQHAMVESQNKASESRTLESSFGLRPQPVDKPITLKLELELVDPRLGLAQLGRQFVRQRHCAVAILVR
jgi:hypothetical protein